MRAALLLVFSAAIPLTASDLGFLQRTWGPRSVAMAGAATASADDPSAVFASPALLSKLEGTSLLLSHEEGLADLWTESLALGHPAFGGTMVWSVIYHHTPDFRGIDAYQEMPTVLRYRNITGLLGYGRTVWERSGWAVAAGAAVKYATGETPGWAPQAWLFDVGLLGSYDLDRLWPNFDEVRLAVAFQDLLPGFSYANKAVVPFRFRTGLSAGYAGILTVAADLVVSEGGARRWATGIEWIPLPFLAVRFGREWNTTGPGFTAGVGVGGSLHRGGLSLEISGRTDPDWNPIVETAVHWTFDGFNRYLTPEARIALQEARKAEAGRRDEFRRRREEEGRSRSGQPPTEPPAETPKEAEPQQPSTDEALPAQEPSPPSPSQPSSDNPYSPDYKPPPIPKVD